MADLGLQGAFGNAGMAAAIRQRIADRLAEAAARQDLDIRAKQEQRAEQAAQDTAAYRQAQMASLADERAAIANERNAQALKLRTDQIPMGATLSPDDAATLPDYLKQHQDAVLGSTAIGGAATLPALPNPARDMTPTADWIRPDGTTKSAGFLGLLRLPNGVASEYSIADSDKLKDAAGHYLDYPSLVPTLTRDEVAATLHAASAHEPVPLSVADKAEQFALQREREGKPLFAQIGEQQNLYPEFQRASLPPFAQEARPAQLVGSLRMIPQAGHAAQDVYTGTADQQAAAQQQEQIQQVMADPETPPAMKQYLRGRLIGVNLPAAALTTGHPKLTPIRTTKNGQPVTTFIDPSAVTPGESFPLPPTNAAHESGPVPDIQPNTKEFKIAQDLAYGRLTFSQFRTLFAYSRDTNTKLALYAKAQELNPNFDPAQFQAGFTLASNPRVQQQLASMDNVIQAVPDLLKFSDAAARSGAPLLNRAIVKGGLEIGGKHYSDFHTAQTAFADELSGALGFGSATDMSRQMGFDMTNAALSPEQFSSAIQNVVVPFIERKRQSLLKQMGPYGEKGRNPAAGDTDATAPASSGGLSYQDYLKAKKGGG